VPALAQTKPKPPAAPAPAAAPAPQALGTFNGWIAAVAGDGASKVCYMRSKPASSESRPARLKRGDVAVAVTHRPGAKQRDEVSFDAGYAIKDGAIVAVEVGQKRFQMFNRPSVDPETAWSVDAATDKALVEAMRAGQSLIVRAVSARGSETVDTVPLAGFVRAYAEIGKACGIK
jgi:invasion protein IalB